MYWDLKQLLMSNRIMKKKPLLLNHVAFLDDDCIAKKVFEEEKDCDIGLVKEVEDFLISNNLSKNTIQKYSKKEWSRIDTKAIEEKNKEDLISLMRDQKKIKKRRFSRNLLK